jgi:very-short-patch-repair endonuclease
MKLSTTEEFIIKINKIHNNKYDYSIVNYINNKTKIEIICKEHGIFEQKPNNHLNGQSCPNKCSKCSHPSKRSTTEEFITKANEIHNNKYDYSKLNYINAKTKVNIICSEHGMFEQILNSHLDGKGCKKCAINKQFLTIEEFIKRSNQVHDNKYDYSLSNYKNNRTKIKIICKKHGKFNQKVNDHLNGSGCSICNSSKGELKIINFLKNNNIKFETQKTFNNCKYKRLLPFDFYLPEQNILIEYDGEQHYGFGRFIDKSIHLRDEIKDVFAFNNGYKMLRIPYTMFDDIEKILKNI